MSSIKQVSSLKLGLLLATGFAAASLHSYALAIDFDSEGLAGPSYFTSVSAVPQTIAINLGGVTVTFSGGVILSAEGGLPADTTSVYSTTSIVSGMSNPLRIMFSQPVQNFQMDLFNGQNASTTYMVANSAGNSTNFTLVRSANGGKTMAGFASTGTEIDISDISSAGTWDFAIDNLHFDQPLQPALGVPDSGGSFGLLASAVSSLFILSRTKAFSK